MKIFVRCTTTYPLFLPSNPAILNSFPKIFSTEMKPSYCPAKKKKRNGARKAKGKCQDWCVTNCTNCKRLFCTFPVASTSFTTRLPAKRVRRMGLSNVLYMTFSYFMYIIFSCKLNVQKFNLEMYNIWC